MHILIGQLFSWLIHCLPGRTLTSLCSGWPCRIPSPRAAFAGWVVCCANACGRSLCNWRLCHPWTGQPEVNFLSWIKGCWWGFSQASRDMCSCRVAHCVIWIIAMHGPAAQNLGIGWWLTLLGQGARNTNGMAELCGDNRLTSGQGARWAWFMILEFSWSYKG